MHKLFGTLNKWIHTICRGHSMQRRQFLWTETIGRLDEQRILKKRMHNSRSGQQVNEWRGWGEDLFDRTLPDPEKPSSLINYSHQNYGTIIQQGTRLFADNFLWSVEWLHSLEGICRLKVRMQIKLLFKISCLSISLNNHLRDKALRSRRIQLSPQKHFTSFQHVILYLNMKLPARVL